MAMTFIEVKTTDPDFNLALEQYVFDQMPRNRGYFMLWQNDNAIIVGRHQNTLAEINEAFVREHAFLMSSIIIMRNVFKSGSRFSVVLGCPGLGGVGVLRSDDGEWS